MSSNWSLSISAAISGSALSARMGPPPCTPSLPPLPFSAATGRAALPEPPCSTGASVPTASTQLPRASLMYVPCGAPMRRRLPLKMDTLRRTWTTPSTVLPAMSSS
jgi:hypothetical protein